MLFGRTTHPLTRSIDSSIHPSIHPSVRPSITDCRYGNSNQSVADQKSRAKEALENIPLDLRDRISDKEISYLVRGANSVRKLIRVKIADDNDLNQAQDSLHLTARFFRRVVKEAKEGDTEPYKLLQLRREGRQIGRTPTKTTQRQHHHQRSSHLPSSSLSSSSSSHHRTPDPHRSSAASDDEGKPAGRTPNSSNTVSALQGRLRERERQRRENEKLQQASALL